jgi:oxygen-independent coproporphyrinogen-3 oxidase
MVQYHHALVKEIVQFARSHPSKLIIDTIHFGGGTPSTYPDNLLLDMIGILKSEFVVGSGAEIALEVNPGTVRFEQLELWSSLCINRLSIGIQSLKDQVLQNLNRHQRSEQVYTLFGWLEGVFDNISIDLIVGLPGVNDAEWKKLVEEVMQWCIKHISIYFLTIHEGTPLYTAVRANQVMLPDDDSVVALYQWTCNRLKKSGFMQYELSNFAKNGYTSRHNEAYWNRVPYRGFGIGACSFDGACRFQNDKNIMRYMRAMEQCNEIFSFHELLTEEQIYLERLMLDLRRPRGIKWLNIARKQDGVCQKNLEAIVQKLEQERLIEWVDDSIRLTYRGLAVENEVLIQLLHR